MHVHLQPQFLAVESSPNCLATLSPHNNPMPFGLKSSYSSSFSQEINLSSLLDMVNQWNSNSFWCEDNVQSFMRLRSLSLKQRWLLPILLLWALAFPLSRRTSQRSEKESCQCLCNSSEATVALHVNMTCLDITHFIVQNCLGDGALSAFWTGGRC